MYIERDITAALMKSRAAIQIVIGPRQCGKSTLLSHLTGNQLQEITFDDLQMRTLANHDPKLFFDQFPPPLLLDEVQYVPQLFSALKQYVDLAKKNRLLHETPVPLLFRMTGSNQILMDKQIKESLAGRASYFYLNTLSVHEILQAQPDMSLSNIIFKGGWPECYIDPDLSTVSYLNDYIRSYIEKDIILSSGIQKNDAFAMVLGLVAARTGQLLDYTNVARDAGVQSVTIKEWISILQRTGLVFCLRPYASNLNKRLTKTPKFYFLDTGLAIRLQGWREQMPCLMSPQIGGLFETLVFGEIYKFIQNYQLDWELYFWRTKEGEEIDFVITTEKGEVIALDAKMNANIQHPLVLPDSFCKLFPNVAKIVAITFSGQTVRISSECQTLPLAQLHDYLMQFV